MRTFLKSIMLEIIKRTIAAVFVGAISRGILIYLETLDIHPDEWIASMLGYTMTPDIKTSILWITSGLFGLVGLIFWPKVEDFFNGLFGRSPIRIIFDPKNPSRRFWGLEMQLDKDRTPVLPVCWQYRVDIRNNSSKTLRNVRVTVESIGQLGSRPLNMPFDKTQTLTVDINPGCSELATILRWPHPKIQAGMAYGNTHLALYSPIRVSASADDVAPKIREFKFDYEKEPMIFD